MAMQTQKLNKSHLFLQTLEVSGMVVAKARRTGFGVGQSGKLVSRLGGYWRPGLAL